MSGENQFGTSDNFIAAEAIGAFEFAHRDFEALGNGIKRVTWTNSVDAATIAISWFELQSFHLGEALSRNRNRLWHPNSISSVCRRGDSAANMWVELFELVFVDVRGFGDVINPHR